MKTTKKLLTLILALAMLFSFAACAGEDVTSSNDSSSVDSQIKEVVNVKLAALKGPTGIGAVHLVNGSADNETNIYDATLYSDPTEVVAECIKGSVDIAAVPTNSAAVIYQKTNGAYQALCLNTLGTLYIMENGTAVTDIKSLEGKTVYATGEGAVPQYVLEYVLSKNGVNCKVEYLTEHSELATKMISGDVKLAMLPQPFVTQVSLKNTNVKIALNLTEEWNKIAANEKNNSQLTMGCFIVKKEFAEKNPESVAQFVKDFGDSVTKVNTDPTAAGDAVQAAGIMDSAAAAAKAIPNCNITCIAGEEMKTALSGFLTVLHTQNPASVGGKLPDDAFYYVAK